MRISRQKFTRNFSGIKGKIVNLKQNALNSQRLNLIAIRHAQNVQQRAEKIYEVQIQRHRTLDGVRVIAADDILRVIEYVKRKKYRRDRADHKREWAALHEDI